MRGSDDQICPASNYRCALIEKRLVKLRLRQQPRPSETHLCSRTSSSLTKQTISSSTAAFPSCPGGAGGREAAERLFRNATFGLAARRSRGSPAHLFVEPASYHNRDVEVSFNGVISLAKTVHLSLSCTSGVLHKGGKGGGVIS